MNISSTQRVDASTAARTTKPASATGKPKMDEAENARKAAAEAKTRRDNEAAASQEMKKVKTVDVTA